MKIPFDKYGLITEQDGNGGDSANRMGLWMWLYWAIMETYPNESNMDNLEDAWSAFLKAMPWLEVEPLVFIRHPDASPDADHEEARDFARWNDPNNFSRDQFLPLVTGIGLTDESKFERIFNKVLRRCGRMQNIDILGPSHWAHLLRVRWMDRRIGWVKQICLCLGDLWAAAGFVLGARKPLSKTSDTLVGFMLLLTAYLIHPTPVSRWSLGFIKRRGRYPERWEIYFGHRNGAQLHTLAEPLFEKYL